MHHAALHKAPSRSELIQLEYEQDTSEADAAKTEAEQPAKRQKRAGWKPSAKAPTRWQEHYDNIKVMRSEKTAPVDTMGCEVLADRTAPPAVFRFQVLVSLMLSSQTKVR